jgi:hypothetical protein
MFYREIQNSEKILSERIALHIAIFISVFQKQQRAYRQYKNDYTREQQESL